MVIYEFIKAFILGVVQGITEWLPISSTGHLILIEDYLEFNLSHSFVSTFFVVIQMGSILAVFVLFFKELNPFKADKQERTDTLNLWLKIAVATIPAAVAGFLFEEQIDNLLYNPITVAVMLILYGIIFIIMENQCRRPTVESLKAISYKLALGIGLFQMLALVPGTSRSGATIVGAMFLGVSRIVVAEFSFFLAIPTMIGASALKLYKLGFDFSGVELMVLLVGSITAFVVSMWAIKFLLDYIKKYSFKPFGYYRIVLGLLVLAVYLLD
ncbi:MAG: undecaprenyl-diphosphate phosphatase [Bacilli bacterium]|nr:undecaprenyl-diphosphate phosphatase [Bacilli bacterium]MDD4298247.1 undecaprenyl-diphosphate phosphatase [Bacilli bacterium]